MSRLAIILFIVIPINLWSQQKIEFIEERIDFVINSDQFSVNGIYYFLNTSEQNINQTILFPFSKNTDNIAVKRVFNLTYSENLSFQKFEDAIAFKIFVLPKDTIKINIAYSQNTVRENIYILESTQAWGKALNEAHYSLTFDKSVHIDSLSLKPDSLCDNTYYWKRKDFYPNENFKVYIK